MPITQTNQSNQLTPQQQDAMATQLILQQQLPRRLSLGTFDLHSGQTLRIPAKTGGLLTAFQVIVRIEGTLTGTVQSQESVLSAFPLISNLQVTDVDGSTRHNSKPYPIHFFNSQNARFLEGGTNQAYNTSQDNLIAYGNYVQGGTDSFAAGFYLEVPLAQYRQGYLRGVINLQVDGSSTAYLELTAANLSALFDTVDNSEALFKSTDNFGTLSPVVTSYSVEIVQVTYQALSIPSLPAFNPVPLLSVNGVYSIEGNVETTSDLVPNGDKYLNVPNGRDVRSALFLYINNKILGGATSPLSLQPNSTDDVKDVQKVAFLKDMANPIILRSRTANALEYQLSTGMPLAKGLYPFDFRQSPVNTNVFGALQAKFTLGSSVTNAKFLQAYEVYYQKGQALANVAQ